MDRVTKGLEEARKGLESEDKALERLSRLESKAVLEIFRETFNKGKGDLLQSPHHKQEFVNRLQQV